MIYLDNAATTFPKPEEVYAEMDRINRTCSVNAGRGAYELARTAMNIIDETKKNLADIVKIYDANKVVFAPSITVAVNEVLNGLTWNEGDYIYVTPYEHNAVARTVELIRKKYKVNVVVMPLVEKTLEIDLTKLKYMFSEHKPQCVCVNAMSNVTGYILPFHEIFEEAKKYSAITVLDTAQALGIVDIDLRKTKADFTMFAGHKTLYGPLGIGGFIYNSDYRLMEFFTGGTGSDSLNLEMPTQGSIRYEPSSPNIVAIAGLNAALKWRSKHNDIDVIERRLTDYAVEKMKRIDGLMLYLPKERVNHLCIISFNIRGYKADEVGMILDQDYSIAVRTGYHCAPYIHRWLKNEECKGTVRMSVGCFNTKEEIDVFISAIEELIDDIQ